jgi:alkanesulfonate monooxygenase SsuD/methylene tetrahydromethanopterin reductase-like flavin-dependent oxidoreductase (luciferase family)
MEFGACVPNYRPGASLEGMLAVTETAERLGWGSVWTTDHLLPDQSEVMAEYGHLYEALATLAWLGGRFRAVRLGISVLIVPMRSAVVLAKELATIDALTEGRLIVGVGIGWARVEFGNVGTADRFGQRGAYLEETIAMWRHLWAGSEGPYEGRFDSFGEVRFSPLPPQGAELPIWIGAAADAALQRVGRIAQGYQSIHAGPSVMHERGGIIRAAAESAARPMPVMSERVDVRFGAVETDAYMFSGSAEDMLREVRAFQAAGVSQLTLDFLDTDPQAVVTAMERFDREVIAGL